MAGYTPTGDYYKDSYYRESKDDYTANRKGSKYYGRGQFSKESAAPYLKAIGKTWDDYKGSPDVQHQVMQGETAWIDKRLEARGHPVTNQNRGAIHNIGIGNYDKMNKPGADNNKSLMKAIRGQAGSPQTIAEYRQHMVNAYGESGTLSQPVAQAPAMVEAVSPIATPEQILQADKELQAKEKLLQYQIMGEPVRLPLDMSPDPLLPQAQPISMNFGNNVGLDTLAPQRLGLGNV